jgi:hypothetical protein
MLSAPARQIVLIVNGIYLLENLKLGDAVAKHLRVHLQYHATTLPAPQRTGIRGDCALSATAPWSTWRGLSKHGRRAVAIPSRKATSGMAQGRA